MDISDILITAVLLVYVWFAYDARKSLKEIKDYAEESKEGGKKIMPTMIVLELAFDKTHLGYLLRSVGRKESINIIRRDLAGFAEEVADKIKIPEEISKIKSVVDINADGKKVSLEERYYKDPGFARLVEALDYFGPLYPSREDIMDAIVFAAQRGLKR